jgi:hypothetical protein
VRHAFFQGDNWNAPAKIRPTPAANGASLLKDVDRIAAPDQVNPAANATNPKPSQAPKYPVPTKTVSKPGSFSSVEIATRR